MPFGVSGLIRLSKLSDYGIVIMTHLAQGDHGQPSAQAIAQLTHIPAPMTSKILKALTRSGLLRSHRGAGGGYELALDPDLISIAQIIEALDGRIALTECIDEASGECLIQDVCATRTNWQRINSAIRHALDGITLAEMSGSVVRSDLLERRRSTARTDRMTA